MDLIYGKARPRRIEMVEGIGKSFRFTRMRRVFTLLQLAKREASGADAFDFRDWQWLRGDITACAVQMDDFA